MKLSKRFHSLVTSARSAAGFTMIELLIVISILGILAVAVLSAINPVEQINRGRDTGSRSDAEQLLSAMDRFNAFQGYYPWVSNPNDDSDLDDGAGGMLQLTDAWVVTDDGTDTDCAVLLRLGNGDSAATSACTGSLELKSSFTQRVTDAGYNPLYLYNNGGQGDSTYVCFVPQSGAFVQEAETRCGTDDGGDGLPDDLLPVVSQICGGHSQGLNPDPTNMMICLP